MGTVFNEVNSGLRILYVDDDAGVRDSFGVMAQACGWQVDLAEDGPAGVSLLRSNPYDVVFTDFGMRGVIGKELTRVAKQLRPNAAVVVISGWDEALVRAEFTGSVQPDCIISKPARLQSLQEALAKLV